MTQNCAAFLRRFRDSKQGKRIVMVAGNFTVIHSGHIRLLKSARSLADILVVGLLPDSPTTHVPQELRLSAMQALDMVDEAFAIPGDLQTCVEALRPDIMVKGAEHEARDNPEEEWLEKWGGRLVFSTDDPRFSLDDVILGMLKNRSPAERMNIPRGYLERHGISLSDITAILEKMSRLKICIVGDLIIDEYVLCTPLGMSREDPTLVVSPLEEMRFVGGAGIVAGHAAGLGGAVSFITVTGSGEASDFAADWFKKYNIDAHLIHDPDRPTTVKRRYKAQNKTMLRVNRLSQQQIDRRIQSEIFERVSHALMDTDLLIFSDFSYGVLPSGLTKKITEDCMERGIPIAADSQTSSQVGDLGKFMNAMLVTPTELEARHAMQNYNQGLVVLSSELMAKINAANVIVTLGEDGCLIYGNPDQHAVFTDRLPALNRRPVDVAGAGDSLLTTASLAMAAGADIWHAALLGSVAAGVQVGRMGNIPLTPEGLRLGLGI